MTDDENVEYVTLLRPAKYETDYDWACALDDELFIANEFRSNAEWAMEEIERRVKAWRQEKDSAEKWLRETDPGNDV